MKNRNSIGMIRRGGIKVIAGALAGSAATACLFAAIGPRANAQTEADSLPVQQYRIIDPDWLTFNSAVLAQEYLNARGAEGWIFPPGTQIARHTFQPGTGAQHTRFVIRPTDRPSEEFVDVIIRREVKP